MDDAGGEGGGVGEAQGELVEAVGEEFCAVADDDGVEEELELVEDTVADEGADEGDAAGDVDVAPIRLVVIAPT